MQTYRLQFSSNTQKINHRIQKARESGASRILVADRQGRALKAAHPQFKWIFETQWQQFDPGLDLWADEIHYLVFTPDFETPVQGISPQSIWVLQPQSLKKRKDWVQWLKWHQVKFPQSTVYIEFEPWMAEKPDWPNVHEVADFLSFLRHHFPKMTFRRRPGVELWDSRIPADFELDASTWWEERIHFHTQDQPQISVIIPSFNNKHFLFKVLEHLGKQTQDKKSFEVIVIDDGGTDETLSFLKTFGTPQDLQIRFVYWPRAWQRKRGDSFFRAGLSRNLGVRLARGSQIVFLDSDILVSKNFISKVMQELTEKTLLQFPRWHIQQSQSHLRTQYENLSEKDLYIEEEKYWRPFFECQDWMAMDRFWKYTCTYALALSKKDFMAAGGFRRFYVSYGFEDTELGYTLAQLGGKFRLLPQPVYHLTSYSHSEYQMSQARRQRLLRRTAKQFFLNTLDLDNYYHFASLMTGEFSWWPRFKKGLGWKDKSTNQNAASQSYSEGPSKNVQD